jgi:hypothetical protein
MLKEAEAPPPEAPKDKQKAPKRKRVQAAK